LTDEVSSGDLLEEKILQGEEKEEGKKEKRRGSL